MDVPQEQRNRNNPAKRNPISNDARAFSSCPNTTARYRLPKFLTSLRRRRAFSRNRITGLLATHTGPTAGTLEQGGSAFVTGQAGRVFAPASMPTWRTTAATWSCGPGLPLSVSQRKRRKTWSSRRDRRPGGNTAPFLATGRSGSASRRSPTSTGSERLSSISTDPKPGHRAPCGMPNPN